MMSRLTSVYWMRLMIMSLFCLAIPIASFSQTTGRIVGEVTDQKTGEPLPGANIVIVGTTKGAATDINGKYTIVNVPAGTYSVEATMIGYQKITKTEVFVAVDRNATVDFNLSESAIAGEEVTIVAERDILHREVSSSQQVIEAEDIFETAGVRTMNDFLGSQAGIQNQRTLTIRGGSAEQTGTLVNGINFGNPRIGKAEATVPLSSIEQVSIQAGGFNAEYGNYRSGILNVITKDGDKDEYHGTISFSRNNAHQKRFGKSLYDPTNNFLLPYLDPIVGFQGTSGGWLEYTNGDEEEALYLNQNHDLFRGYNDFATRYNRSVEPGQEATPMDLYLWTAWMHMVTPDFDRLEELYPEYEITDAQKQALREHAHEPESENADWDLDFGFGGPLPFLSKQLGNATFYLSNKSTFQSYVQPVIRDGEQNSTTMLTIKSNITDQMTLKLNGIYRFLQGSQSDMPTDGNIPDLANSGDMMPINNLDIFTREGEQYYFHPTFYQPKDQKTYVFGLNLNNVVNNSTFWDFTVSYARTKDVFEPETTRNRDGIINFGPIWVNEMPYGVTFTADTVYNPNDASEFYVHDLFEAPYGLTRRYSAKVGQFHENSLTQQFKAKFDVSSQVNNSNFAKTGLEFTYFDIDNNNWRWWEGFDTIYELRDRRKPWQLGGYVQDQISLKGMEANIGLRFDYYNSGGDVWPSGDPYNEDAFTRGTEWDNPRELFDRFSAGETVTWNRWNAVNDTLGGFLEKTENHFTVSPRLGISFPVTDRSKFYFNYGHFRSTVPFSQMYMYKFRFAKEGLYDLGNPNLEPPRTISYELGLDYNLFDQYLVQASTYYKDISGEASEVNYSNNRGTVSYSSFLNNRWEKDQGFELRVAKTLGQYLTGWVNFWFIIDKNGLVGREFAYEDPTRNLEETSLRAGEENTPELRPRASANFSLHAPQKWGVFSGWMASILPTWERGSEFELNPSNQPFVGNNVRWPDYWKLDFKLTKSFEIAKTKATFFVDISNVTNRKINWMSNEWAFRNNVDYTNYLASLRLPLYSSSVFDNVRDEEAGRYVPGNDEIGDLRSSEQPYINNPDNLLWAFGEPRDIWFGIRFDF